MTIGKTQIIHLPTYLDVLSQLPDVPQADIEQSRKILERIFEDNFSKPIEFEQGTSIGDGKIETAQIYRGEGSTERPFFCVFEEGGKITCSLADSSGLLPPTVAPYFFAGIFGGEEMVSPANPPAREVLLTKAEGIRDLYRCVISGGDIFSCRHRSLFDQKLTQADRLLLAQRDADLKTARDIWQSAEELREASRGWAAGDPDSIQEIMDRYASYRFYRGENEDEVEAAKVRREKAEAMMRDIAYDSGGWPQFKNRFCGEWEEVGQRVCRGAGGVVVEYEISCQFGVDRTKRRVDRERGDKRDHGEEVGRVQTVSDRAADKGVGFPHGRDCF